MNSLISFSQTAWIVVRLNPKTTVSTNIDFVPPQTGFYRSAIEAAVKATFGPTACLVDWELPEPNDTEEALPWATPQSFDQAQEPSLPPLNDEDWAFIAALATGMQEVAQ